MCNVPTPSMYSERQNVMRGGQVVFPMGVEICIPEDDMVRFFAREFDKLDYSSLYAAYCDPRNYSSPGRPRIDPKLLFLICAFVYSKDIYSSRKIEEACRKHIDFIWLLDGAPAPDHTTIANFRSGRCKEAIEDLFYQHARYLYQVGATDYDVGIFDGTKIESFANRYTFVWRGTVEKNLAKLMEKAKTVFDRIPASIRPRYGILCRFYGRCAYATFGNTSVDRIFYLQYTLYVAHCQRKHTIFLHALCRIA